MNVPPDAFDPSVKETVDSMVVSEASPYKCVLTEKGSFVRHVAVLFFVMSFSNFDQSRLEEYVHSPTEIPLELN